MYKKHRSTRKIRGGALTDVLPTTSWGNWTNTPGALQWSASSQAPAPLANGGLYNGPQSTGAWASQPFPATQYAMAVEASRVGGNPDLFYQQRPNDNNGASFSPFVGSHPSPQYWSATMGAPLKGGKRTRKYRKANTRKHRKHRKN